MEKAIVPRGAGDEGRVRPSLLLLLLLAKKRNTGEEGLLHRVAKIVEPDEAEARGLARHPRVVEGLVKLSEEVPQVALLRIVRQAADVHLETLRHHRVSRGGGLTGKASRCVRTYAQ
jgi:hypothetical protein